MARFKTFIIVIIFNFISCVCVASYAASMNGIRLWIAPDNTRVVLDLDQEVEYRNFLLDSPHRLVIDIYDTSLINKKIIKDVNLDNTDIAQLRYSNKEKYLRLVFDLKQKIDYKVFTLKPNEIISNHRIVLDLMNNGDKKVATLLPQITSVSKQYRKFNVIIDPGHGGEDPGSIGRRGTREKDVVLQISKYLKQYIDEDNDMQAILTRDGDYYIGLYERTQKARHNQADLFVSVHADGFRDPRAKGASVFTLSERGASSELAKWIADKENASDLIGGVSLDNKDTMLATVLLDLSQTASNQASNQVANNILNEISKVTYLHKSQVEKARFVVLKSPDIPSLLIETGFITNPNGESSLRSSTYQREVAQAIYKGIKLYLKTQPRPLFDNVILEAKNDR